MHHHPAPNEGALVKKFSVLLAASIGLLAVAGIAPAASTGPATSVVKITALANGLQFNTKVLRAHPGKVTIVFTNLSSVLKHNVRIKSGSKQLGGTKIIGKGTTKATVTLKKGTYTFYCSVPGHEAAGMKGKLIVS